jgi:predicted transcriptional regulator
MEDKIARCGVIPYDQFKERTIKIAKGEYKPGADEPKIWFESLNAAEQILDEEEMRLLIQRQQRFQSPSGLTFPPK